MIKRVLSLLALVLVIILSACGPTGPGTPNTKPAVPRGLRVQAGNSEATLNWQANTESNLLKYIIYYGFQSANLNLKQNVAKDKTNATIIGLSNGKKYYFAISAVNTSQKESAKSNEVSASPQAAGISTPKNFKAKAGNQKVMLSWTANTETDLKQYIISYGVNENSLANSKIAKSDQGSIEITGLQNKTKYYFKIEAENKSGQKSPPSAIISATPDLNDNTAPTIISTQPKNNAKDVPLATTIKVKFSEEMLEAKTSIKFTPTVSCSNVWNSNSDELSCTPTKELDPSKTYQVELTAEDLAGNKLTKYNFSFTTASKAGPGSLDKTFGTNGIFNMNFGIGGNSRMRAAVIVNDKIYIAANANFKEGNIEKSWIVLIRLNSDGSLDKQFDSKGYKKYSISSGDNYASAMIYNAGKLYLAGSANGYDDMAILSFNLDGSFNKSFNSTGVLIKDFGDVAEEARAIAFDDTLKIFYIMGRFYNVLALDSSGKTVNGFGANGYKLLKNSLQKLSTSRAILIKNTKIYIAGSIEDSKGSNFAIVSVDKTGKLNSGFSGNGVVETDISQNNVDYAYDDIYRLIELDNKLLAVGERGKGNDFALARYDFSSGVLDKAFANNGIMIDNLGKKISDVKIDNKNRIVVLGEDDDSNFVTARYLNTGTFDASFGLNGHVTIANTTNPHTLIIDKNGKILAAGSNHVARVLP